MTRKIAAVGRPMVLIAAALLPLGGCESDSAAEADDPSTSQEPIPNPSAGEVPAGWQEYSTTSLVADWEMQLDHPARIEFNEIDGGVTFRYIGPDSPPASEMTDGYLVSITPIEAESLDAWIAERDLAGVDTIDWRGTAARSWSTESELDGTAIPHLGLPAGAASSPVPLDVAINISGDVEGRYHAEVDRILATMRWSEGRPRGGDV